MSVPPISNPVSTKEKGDLHAEPSFAGQIAGKHHVAQKHYESEGNLYLESETLAFEVPACADVGLVRSVGDSTISGTDWCS